MIRVIPTFLIAFLAASCSPPFEEQGSTPQPAESAIGDTPSSGQPGGNSSDWIEETDQPQNNGLENLPEEEQEERLPEESENPRSMTLCGFEAGEPLPLAPEGAFLPQGTQVDAHRDACTTSLHATAGAQASTLTVTLSKWDGDSSAEISAIDLTGAVLLEPTPLQDGEHITVPLTQTGELLIHLAPMDPNEAANDYALTVVCTNGCEAEYTRYPVVFLHGLAGADSFGNIDYYNGVRSYLEPKGYALFAPAVIPYATTAARALQWETRLEELAENGLGRRFNLIGHSQGGLDARYLVGVLGRHDLIASIITVGAPHHGTPLANLFFGLTEEGPIDPYWVDLGATAFALFFGLEAENNSLVDAMGSMTPEVMAQFNEFCPDHDDVYYASWAGVSCGALEKECQAACDGEIVGSMLAITYFILWLSEEPNDGMVPVSSAIWGDYRGEICADHADQVGLFPEPPNNVFDHLNFYLEEVRRLAELGF